MLTLYREYMPLYHRLNSHLSGTGHCECLTQKVMPPFTLTRRRKGYHFLVKLFKESSANYSPNDHVIGILDSTRTSLGRILLRQWLLRPSLSLEVINSRHDAVECFSRADNIVTATAMHNHLKGLKNIPRIMKLLKVGKAGLLDWEGLVKVSVWVKPFTRIHWLIMFSSHSMRPYYENVSQS